MHDLKQNANLNKTFICAALKVKNISLLAMKTLHIGKTISEWQHSLRRQLNMSEHEKQVRKFPRHIRAYLRKKIHQDIFKDEYKAIAEAIKAKIKQKEEQEKQMEFNFSMSGEMK